MEGLPAGRMMDETYVNVWAVNTLSEIQGGEAGSPETVVASLGFDWFSRNHKMHYSGPGSSWWGSDLGIIPYGKGYFILSQLRILNHLESDPVADKILVNLVKFSTEL